MAVLMVLLAHADVVGTSWAGAVGVGIFFTLSGFLITALLLEERERAGRIALGSFYRRRAVRLLPALFVMLATVTVLAPTGIFGVNAPGGWQIFGVAAYVGNWVRLAGPIVPYSHTWSLAVEEQFYILWPLVVIVVTRFRSKALFPVTVGLIAVSVVARFVLLSEPGNELRVYFGTDTNAVALLGGCALAVLLKRRGAVRVARSMAAVCCLALLGAGALAGAPLVSSNAVYTWLPLAITAFTVFVIASLVTNGSFVMRNPVLRWFGSISYGLYLWHLPVFVAYERLVGPIGGQPGPTALAVALSVGVAYCSWIVVERPLLRFKAPRAIDLRTPKPHETPNEAPRLM